jgi:hypothetical protein
MDNCIYLLYLQGDVWICMEVMDTSLDKFYKKIYEDGQIIPETVLGIITLSVSYKDIIVSIRYKYTYKEVIYYYSCIKLSCHYECFLQKSCI